MSGCINEHDVKEELQIKFKKLVDFLKVYATYGDYDGRVPCECLGCQAGKLLQEVGALDDPQTVKDI